MARMFLVHGPASREERDFVAESGCSGAFEFLPALEEAGLRQFYGSADVLLFPPSTRDSAGPLSKLWERVVR